MRAQNDPSGKNFQKMKDIIFQNLSQQNFPKSKEGKSVIFIGRTSSGKSSLLNALFGLSLKTSKGSCTQQIQCVGNYTKVQIFDFPGFDTHMDITKHP